MSPAGEEPDLTRTEIALNRVRLVAFAALQAGATRHEVDAEVAEAQRILDRIGRTS